MPSLLKVGRSFFLPKGTARSCQSQPAGSQRLGVPVLAFYAWLPPPKQKQVPARLQPSPQRGAAQRGELAPTLLGINLLLCPGLLPCSGLPRDMSACRIASRTGPGTPPRARTPLRLRALRTASGCRRSLPALLPRVGNPDPGQQGSRDLQREAGTVVMASRTNRREREPWVSRPRHLPGAP